MENKVLRVLMKRSKYTGRQHVELKKMAPEK